MSVDYKANIAKYASSVDEKAVAGIVKHLGIALKSSKDAALVSCSSKDELARVRDSWLKKKLALSDADADLDKAIKSVCETMKGEHDKSRVTFYYLLAAHYNKLGAL
jgi:hypothetical protein